MTRPLTALALVLVLLAGILAGKTTAMISHDAAPASQLSASQAAHVRAFYEGMNSYLSTGDDAFLKLLAPGYQDFTALDSPAGSAESLLSRLDTMRQSAVRPHFTIEVLSDLGPMVAVRVTTDLPAAFDAAGLSIAVETPPVAFEFVEMQRGAIVARWSQGDLIPSSDHLLDTPLAVEAGDAVMFNLSRVTLDPNGELSLSGKTPIGLLIEEGTVTLTNGATSLPIAPGSDQWFAPDGLARIANTGFERVTFWVVSIGVLEPDYGGFTGLIDPPKRRDVTVTRLVWSAPYPWPGNPTELRVRIARVTLPPGAHLPASAPGMGEVLAVLDGTLAATVSEGMARQRGPNGHTATVREHASLSAGQGIAADPDAVVTYHVTGSIPATVFVLTAAPAAA